MLQKSKLKFLQKYYLKWKLKLNLDWNVEKYYFSCVMQLFYTSDIRGDFAYFNEEEARHCVQVLRHKVGDALQFVDGNGTFYEGKIIETGKKKCVLSIKKQEQAYTPGASIHIGIAPTKNISRFEWFLEKATEIGVQQITPVICQRSERKKIRGDRLSKILVSAMKQSLKATLPQFNPLTNFKSFIMGMERQKADTQRFIAFLNKEHSIHLKEKYESGKDVIILIGPEGGFTKEEVNWAKDRGYEIVSLGNSRLRTETAGIVACHTFALGNI